MSFIGLQNGEAIDATLSASAYGKKSSIEELKEALEKEVNGGNEVFYVNKNAISLAAASPDLSAIKALIEKIHSSDGFIHNITDNDSPVKVIPKKPTETIQFSRWFGDSKAKNSDGSPMIVYHGTDAEFDVFDYGKHGGKHGSAKGHGIYLATTRGLAEHYGDRIISAYVRIENPASTTEKKYTLSKTRRLVKALCEYDAKQMLDDYDGDLDSALRDTWVSNYVNTYDAANMEQVYSKVAKMLYDNNTNDSDIINEIMNADGLQNDESAAEFYKNVLTPATGTDGFIINDQGETVYIAFESPQIKSTDNIGLFDRKNPNIRYSIMDKQFRMTKQGAARMFELHRMSFQSGKSVILLLGSEEDHMASSKEYLMYVLEQLSALPDVSVRPMMGEYVLYYTGRVVGGIYDDRLLLKPTRSALRLLSDPQMDIPYEGAKPHLVANPDEAELTCRVIEAIAADLPEPKPRGKRK